MSIERTFAGREFQVEGVDREKAGALPGVQPGMLGLRSFRSKFCTKPAVSEKTCATTQKKRKKSCFLIFEKKT